MESCDHRDKMGQDDSDGSMLDRSPSGVCSSLIKEIIHEVFTFPGTKQKLFFEPF